MEGFVHIRVDDRLIHGQVATRWATGLKVNRIMTVSYTHLDVYKRQRLHIVAVSLLKEGETMYLAPEIIASLAVSASSTEPAPIRIWFLFI